MCIKSLTKIFTAGLDKPSPSDIVRPDGIQSSTTSVTIDFTRLNIPFSKTPRVWIPSIPDTNSMDPSFDFGHNNILIAGDDAADHQTLIDFLKVGDIAVYRIPPDFTQPAVIYVIHRIVDIGQDGQGRYFWFQGDNNAGKDPHKVRDENILYLCIGTIF